METQESYSNPPRFTAAQREERIRSMIQELLFDAAALNDEIEDALRSARAKPRDYAYPSYAKATAQRRDNLLRTVEDLKTVWQSAHAAPRTTALKHFGEERPKHA
jgi:flagellar FliJ protein